MQRLEVEFKQCSICGSTPKCMPMPSECFPTSYRVYCDCKNRNMIHCTFGYKTKSANGLITRRLSLNTAIRAWNRHVERMAGRLPKKSSDIRVKCKFCNMPGLIWGKRPYKNRWLSGGDYVLYERIKTDKVCALTGISRIERVIHNCTAHKNIVKVEYTQA